MNKILSGICVGILFIALIGIVSANTVQVDVDNPLIIKAYCAGTDATADIQIYTGATNNPENLWLARTTMLQVSPSDFLDRETFSTTGTYTAFMECTYDGGFVTTQTTAITVTEYTNLITTTTLQGYHFEAALYYDVFFKLDPSRDKTIRFDLGTDTITLEPRELNIINELDTKKQLIKNPQSSAKAVSNNNVVSYPNVYGQGLTLDYNINTRYIKEDLVINSAANLPTAKADLINPYLELNFLMTTTTKHFIVDGVEWDIAHINKVSTSNRILINDNAGNTIYVLEVPVAFDSNGAEVVGKYILKKDGANVLLSIQMPYSWFKDTTRVFPIYVDPTIDTPDGTSTFQSSIPRIVISDLSIPADQPYEIREQIMLDNQIIYDAECETDIYDVAKGINDVDFRSFYNYGWGYMTFTWGIPNTEFNPDVGVHQLRQYCWRGDTLVLNKIYSNSTITVY